MNAIFFRYKTRLLTLALILGYAYLHVRLTGIYADTTLERFIDFSARLPFGQRLLVPSIAHFISIIIPLKPEEIFFLLEVGFVSLLYVTIRHLLQHEFKPSQAKLLSWLFILLLPLMSVINYRYTTSGDALFFYPYDSASLFFIAAGFLFCIRSQWSILIPLVFLATFNRESAVLLILLIPALHWQQIRLVLKPFALACLAFLIARLIVLYFVSDLPGPLTEWYFRESEFTHFSVNLAWLLNEQHILFFMFCFAGLPLFWFVFHDYIPQRFQPLRFIALFYFLCLLLVGNFIEARVFGEVIVLLYMPVCVGINRWLAGWQPDYASDKHFSFYISRYSVLIILAIIVLGRTPLNQGVIWLSGFF